MSSHMPPIPPANRSPMGAPRQESEAPADTSHKNEKEQNSSEQGETANIKQNTTNKGYFRGRRVK